MNECTTHLMVTSTFEFLKLCLPLQEVLSKMEACVSRPVICAAFTNRAWKNKETSPSFEIWALEEQVLFLVI